MSWKAWSRFWFESDGHVQIDAFRRVFALVLFSCYSIRSLDLKLFFSKSGLAPVEILPDLVDMKYRFSVFLWLQSDWALWGLNGLFLASLVLMSLGIATRWATIIATVLHISFLHRNPAGSYGIDTIANFFLAYLCLADDRRSTDRKQGDVRAMLGSMAYRLCQVQLCVIYAFAGLHKLKGVLWWKGEAVWAVFANAQMARFDFSWVAQYPLLMVVGTYLTLAWEIYFPAIVWFRSIRYYVLFFGLLFHFAIGLTMSIPFFAAMMVSAYIVFLDAKHIKRIFGFFQSRVFFLKFKPDTPNR